MSHYNLCVWNWSVSVVLCWFASNLQQKICQFCQVSLYCCNLTPDDRDFTLYLWGWNMTRCQRLYFHRNLMWSVGVSTHSGRSLCKSAGRTNHSQAYSSEVRKVTPYRFCLTNSCSCPEEYFSLMLYISLSEQAHCDNSLRYFLF